MQTFGYNSRMALFWITLLLTTVAIGWLMTIFSLPGNWLIALSAAVYAWLTPAESGWGLSWTWVGVLVGLALLGEIIEFIAGAMGVKRRGGSRRGAVLAIVGSIAGGMLGATLGLPIPLIGAPVGIIFGASFGAMGGAVLGETWHGKSPEQSLHIGRGAFWGRLFGSLAKTILGTLMAALVVVALALNFLS